MAHSHDRTLVQQLGADLDHKTPAHDAACLYLQQRAMALAERFCRHDNEGVGTSVASLKDFKSYFNEEALQSLCVCMSCWFDFAELPNNYRQGDPSIPVNYQLSERLVESVDTSLERLVTKGEGKYQSLIGFLDLVIVPKVTLLKTLPPRQYVLRRCCHNKDHKNDSVFTFQYPGRSYRVEEASEYLIVEVKTLRCPIGDLIRQIKLYREYTQLFARTTWIVATTYPLNEREVDALRNESIIAIRVNEDYAAVVEVPARVESF